MGALPALSFSEQLNAAGGGCQLVTLRRAATLSATVPAGASASISLLCRISANASSEIGLVGLATGSMECDVVGRFTLTTWVLADTLFEAAADTSRQSAQTSITASFVGPIDPSTGHGVLIADTYAGETHGSISMPARWLAPGTYELRLVGDGAFLLTGSFAPLAQVNASAQVSNATPTPPPAHLDITGDGRVDLDDACAWTETATDANQDGTTDALDLALIAALARAAGDDVTDTNQDGIPDQCACPGDWNADGVLDFFDVQAYLAAFAAGTPEAELTGDGTLDFFDLQRFLSDFSSGCTP
jgi:hypothetical protein